MNDRKLPFPPVDRNEFVHPSNVVKPYPLWRHDDTNETVSALLLQRKFNELAKRLEQAGFRKISRKIRKGSSAIVLEANNHQMIRVVSVEAHESERSTEPYVLQPIATINTLDGFRIEVLPKVHTLEEIVGNPILEKEYGLGEYSRSEAEEHIKWLMVDALHKGNLIFDPSPANIALIKDEAGYAVPLLIDAGGMDKTEACDLTDMHTLWYRSMTFEKVRSYTINTHHPLYVSDMDSKMRKSRFLVEMRGAITALTALEHEPYPYAQAQEAHLKLLALTRGKPNNVISDNDMMKYCSRGLNPKGAYASLVSGGFYKDEIAGMIAKALDAHAAETETAPGNRRGLCEHIMEQRAISAAEPRKL